MAMPPPPERDIWKRGMIVMIKYSDSTSIHDFARKKFLKEHPDRWAIEAIVVGVYESTVIILALEGVFSSGYGDQLLVLNEGPESAAPPPEYDQYRCLYTDGDNEDYVLSLPKAVNCLAPIAVHQTWLEGEIGRLDGPSALKLHQRYHISHNMGFVPYDQQPDYWKYHIKSDALPPQTSEGLDQDVIYNHIPAFLVARGNYTEWYHEDQKFGKIMNETAITIPDGMEPDKIKQMVNAPFQVLIDVPANRALVAGMPVLDLRLDPDGKMRYVTRTMSQDGNIAANGIEIADESTYSKNKEEESIVRWALRRSIPHISVPVKSGLPDTKADLAKLVNLPIYVPISPKTVKQNGVRVPLSPRPGVPFSSSTATSSRTTSLREASPEEIIRDAGLREATPEELRDLIAAMDPTRAPAPVPTTVPAPAPAPAKDVVTTSTQNTTACKHACCKR